MNFGFTEEQELLRAEVRKFLDQNCPLDEVRKLSESPEGFGRHLWDRMAELGWVGLTFPEVHGGAGLGWVDLVVVLEEPGRSLFPSPLVSTVLVGTALGPAGSDAQREEWLPQLAAGTAIGALAVQEGEGADPMGIELEGTPDGDGFRHARRMHQIELVEDYAADCFVRANGSELVQEVNNFINNAIDAMGAVGTLTLTTGQDHDSAWLTVGDTGDGMDEATRSRIFEPFFTTKPPGEGTGLGLYVCQRILDNHGASLELESAPGEGTCFRVRFPKRSD